jgi:hypothetical protein
MANAPWLHPFHNSIAYANMVLVSKTKESNQAPFITIVIVLLIFVLLFIGIFLKIKILFF